jgi:site-specific recombinase XerD
MKVRKSNEITYRIVYDRRKVSALDKLGAVEIEVYIDRYHRKFISTGVKCYPHEWANGMVQYNPNAKAYNEKIIGKLREVQKKFAQAKYMMGGRISPAMLLESLNTRSERGDKSGSFIDFMLRTLQARTDIQEQTKNRHRVVIDALLRFGGIRKFADLTPQRVMAFDEFLRTEKGRMQTTLKNYHKVVAGYTKKAKFDSLIEDDPYDHVKIEKGKSKERRPLTEDEVLILREWMPTSRQLEKARDLFIFSCYTGLAYADAQSFVFSEHTTIIDSKYYIDGARIKTGERYLTPILAPALDILKKWDYRLPIMSNVRMNYSLHEIEAILGINKPLTSHVARHTFATLTLSKNVPIAVVQRLLGHSDIKTTQIYAKVMAKTVADAVGGLDDILK